MNPDSLLSEALRLHDLGYHLASAVTARAALEVELRELCKARNCPPWGKRARLSHFVANLRRHDLIDKATAKLIYDVSTLAGVAAHNGATREESRAVLRIVWDLFFGELSRLWEDLPEAEGRARLKVFQEC